MTIILSEAQEALYNEGWETAGHVEDDCVELAYRQNMQGPVVVETIAGRVLFALTPATRGENRGKKSR